MSTFKFSYEGPYVVHRGKMLESDAYRSLGKTELKILARLEIELMRHRGTNNGRIICTYDDFAEYGIRRPSIPRALRRLRKVGLLVVTQRGRRSALRNPHHYRLPYLLSHDEAGNIIAPTDEWKSYRPIRPPKNGRSAQKSGNENVPGTGNENVPVAPENTRNENVPAFYNLSISSPGGGCLGAEAAPFGIGHNAGPPLNSPIPLKGLKQKRPYLPPAKRPDKRAEATYLAAWYQIEQQSFRRPRNLRRLRFHRYEDYVGQRIGACDGADRLRARQ
jgi:hypothetical protein